MSRGVVDDRRPAVRDDGAVVGGVVEGRAGEHQRVDERDLEGDVDAVVAGGVAHGPLPGRGVQVDGLADSDEQHGQHLRAAVGDGGDVADEGLVEDLVHRGGVVAGPLLQA